MFVVMSPGATETELNGVRGAILEEGLTPHENRSANGTVIAVLGEGSARLARVAALLGGLPGVAAVRQTETQYKLASREFHPDDTVVEVNGVRIGDGSFTLMAGPCAVESRDQLFETADAVKAAGANVLRGGAFKPRTSPYSFQGLGLQGLRFLAEARERTGLPVITEVMEPGQVEHVAEYADILQIGARNMQNYSLLMAVGKAGRPVLIKRALSGTIDEWLMAAEYVMSSGNPGVILCERGIRTFETATRNTLDIAAVPLIHHLTHLPVIIDPSHATGKRWLVQPLSMAAAAIGADGLIIEVHPRPAEALSDGPQSITLDQFSDLAAAVRPIHELARAAHAVRGPAMAQAGRHPAVPARSGAEVPA